jgi:chitinase
MPGTTPPRNVIYFSGSANPIPFAGIRNLPYTDIIVAFLIPDDNLKLYGSGGAFDDNLKSNIQTLQSAGKNVLISLGGSSGFPSSAYQSYAKNVTGLVEQLVSFVTSNGFNGVDIDYEDDAGFTGTYDGIGFLVALTNGLAKALPSGQNIITHAPQTPYWDPNYNNAPYAKIWQGAGDQIAWINNQFYNNAPWDASPGLKVEWYNNIARITGAQKLMVGAPVAAAGAGEGYIPLAQMIGQVIGPLKTAWGPEFGGVMGWEFQLDQGGTWAEGIWQGLAGPDTSAPSLYQGSWIPGTSNYEYGYNSIPNVPITGAPADADFSRFSMLYDGSAYRLYTFRRGSSDTLYQFSWDGSSYEYGYNSIPVLTLTGTPGDADTSSISMLHEGSTYHAYLKRLGDPSILYQFIWIPGTSTYQYGSPGFFPSLPVTGFPADTDWSRWTMLHDASTYRIYAFRNGVNNLILQGSWNAAAAAYQYAFNSIPELNLVDFPANSNFGRAAMLYDGTYRFYFQSM